MWPNPQQTADLVTFTEEILNGKLKFLCSDNCSVFYCKFRAYWFTNWSQNYCF